MRTICATFGALCLMIGAASGQDSSYDAGLYRGHVKIFAFHCGGKIGSKFNKRVVELKRLDKRAWRRGYRAGQAEIIDTIQKHGKEAGCLTAAYLYGDNGQTVPGALLNE